jgi:hypothetical protein
VAQQILKTAKCCARHITGLKGIDNGEIRREDYCK